MALPMTPDQAALYRAMSPAQRLNIAFGLHDFAYRRVVAAITRDRRQLTDRELRHEVLRRFIGEPGSLLRGGAGRA
jgi:DUF1365 family protein